MKKKIFSILLSLCMVLTMIPVATGTVWAEGTSVTIGGKTLSADTPYYHNGENGMAGTVNDSQEGANATFEPDTGTLTLNGLELTSGNIIATGNLTIKLVGENTLGNESYSGNVIFVKSGKLVIKEAGSLTVKNGNNTQTTIYVGGNITIDGGANVSATHADGGAQAIHASGQGQITISGAGTEVTATHNGTGSSDSADYVALKAGTIQISAGAKLTAKGEAKAVDGTLSVNPLENYMIYAGDREPGTEKSEIANLTDKYLKVEPKNAASTALENVTFGYAYDVQRSPDFPSMTRPEITLSELSTNAQSGISENSGSWTLTKVGTYSYVESQKESLNYASILDSIVDTIYNNYEASGLKKETIVIHELKNGEKHIAYGVVIAYDAAKNCAVFIGDKHGNGGAGYLLSKEAQSGSVTIDEIKIATDFVKDISIKLVDTDTSTDMNPTETYVFPAVTAGYTDSNLTPKGVTITNTGNAETGELTVTLSNYNGFIVVPENRTISSITEGGSATFSIKPQASLSQGTYTATVTVSGRNIVAQSFGVSFTVNNAVTKPLDSIAVTTAPAKTNYTAGEDFDPTGMVVTATYSDSSTKAITGYTFTPNAALKTDDTSITISYTEGEVTKTTTQAITVNALEYNITVTDGKATQSEGTEISKASEDTRVTLTANAAPSGKEFDKWVVEKGGITLEDANSATTTFTMPAGAVSVKATYKDVPHTGGGSHSSSIQKPTIIAGEGAETSLSILGTNLTIKMTEGYELTDVILNGVSKGKVTELTGLRTGDKVEVKTEKKQEKPSKEEIIAALDSSKLVARSKLITLENGKKAVRVTWYDQNGNEINFDGIEVYRSVKRYKGYGLEPFYTTKGDKSEGYYVNTKDLKEGTTYYYKVRGYVTIDGQKYYTDYSDKAWRTIK